MSKTNVRPRITITGADHERLTRIADAAAGTMPEVAAILADELDRAQILPGNELGEGIVRMGSEVEFRDDVTSRVQKVVLVYPDEADISKGRVSVLTPIGAALIGLSVGQSITWETRSGEERSLTVLSARDMASVV